MKNFTSNLILFICILIAYSSCQRQVHSEKNNELNSTETIKTDFTNLGKNAAIIFQDSKNNYWFGGNGVFRFDGKKLTHFTKEDGLFSNQIRSIQEDHLGNIFIETIDGINKFDRQNIEKIELKFDSASDWKLEPNDLWFGGVSNKKGPLRYDGKTLHLLEFPKHKFHEEFYSEVSNPSFSPYDIYKVFKDSKGNIWFGTGNFGACRFDGTTLRWISEREMSEMDPGPAPGVRSIVEDKEGNFWFSSNVDHKYQLLPKDSPAQNQDLDYQKLKGIDTSKKKGLENYFNSMTSDNLGNIWMATYDAGVWKYDGKKLVHYPINDDKKDVLIFSIYKDKKGNIWLGTFNAGALKFNGKTFEKFKSR